MTKEEPDPGGVTWSGLQRASPHDCKLRQGGTIIYWKSWKCQFMNYSALLCGNNATFHQHFFFKLKLKCNISLILKTEHDCDCKSQTRGKKPPHLSQTCVLIYSLSSFHCLPWPAEAFHMCAWTHAHTHTHAAKEQKSQRSAGMRVLLPQKRPLLTCLSTPEEFIMNHRCKRSPRSQRTLSVAPQQLLGCRILRSEPDSLKNRAADLQLWPANIEFSPFPVTQIYMFYIKKGLKYQ